jgi:hypothetical protein
MRGAHVENPKISLGAMVRMQVVNLRQLYFKQKKQKQLLCVCASNQRTLHIVMAHI